MTTSTAKITVIPAAGRLVMNPVTGQPLPSAEARPQGTRLPLNTYWHKRLASGDVQPVTESAPAPTTTVEEDASATPSEASASKTSKPKDK